jgi:Fe-S-cluster formation regulator IscX/YfhJ
MSDNQKRILDMLAEGKISADEAQKLLAAIGAGGEETKSTSAPHDAKYLRVVVVPDPDAPKSEDVKRINVRIPLSLIRAGIKFTSLIPADASEQVNEALKEKGIDFDVRNLKPEDLEELIAALHDLEVDIQNGQEKVHVYVE